LFDRISPLLMPKLNDGSKPKTEDDSLFRSDEAGRALSGDQPSRRRTSLYTAAQLHRGSTAAVGLVVAAGVVSLLARGVRRA
jgi:hypothetical protein